MLVVHNNQKSCNWRRGDNVPTPPCKGDVVVAIDPSKTNMAILLGTPNGEVFDTIEFSGNNRRRGPAMDTTLYCEEVRMFLGDYLKDVDLYMVGVEQAITKEGSKYHHSDLVLKEIRSNILNFFLEHFNIRVTEINNWSWKSHVLPKGYRSMYEKGSKKWFTQNMPDSPWCQYFEADMTDCVCIYIFMCQTLCKNYTQFCNRHEDAVCKYNYLLMPTAYLDTKLRTVTYNPRYTMEENMNYYVNRNLGQFCFTMNPDALRLEDIYGHVLPACFDFSCIGESEVAVKVVRT